MTTSSAPRNALALVIKSSRDIMRKDKGLNGELDRLPMLTWLLFLKFLDDHEAVAEAEARLSGRAHVEAIAPPYRWRDWAAVEGGLTGDALLAFVSNEEAVRPDGTRGPGLLPYLRALHGGEDPRRDTIATVFGGVVNRMLSGYLLRDVVEKLNGVHFESTREAFSFSVIYESMLKEMRDAAGDSGEFYTPRSVVRFMVECVNPQPGETVFDPACGTGGFLVEAFRRLKEQCETVADLRWLQREAIAGGEAKSLPFMLAQMNLLLHGMEVPRIDPGNSLRRPLRDYTKRDQVDVILTNPPFGGEEEKGVLANFPVRMRATETAVLFLQLIMKRLREPTTERPSGGRCAIVVSDGFLSTRGVHARVKEALLSQFRLHSIVRLPRGVFAPYTPIKTNILFFDRSGPTSDVWFYELPKPDGRQMYTKTKPLEFEAFRDCLDWWNARVANDVAWVVSADELRARDCDFDLSNPRQPIDAAVADPETVLAAAKTTVDALKADVSGVEALLRDLPRDLSHCPATALSDALVPVKETVTLQDDEEYQLVTVQLHGRGMRPRERRWGRDIKVKKARRLRTDQLVVAEIDAKLGGFAVVPAELDGAVVSMHYFVYDIRRECLSPRYLEWFLRSSLPEAWIQPYVKGSTNYASVRAHHFPLLRTGLPSVPDQDAWIGKLDQLSAKVEATLADLRTLDTELASLIPSVLNRRFDHPQASA